MGTFPILSFALYEDTISINNIKLIAPGGSLENIQSNLREGVNVEKM